MSTAKEHPTPPVSHTVCLNNGAMNFLAQILSTAGLLSGESDHTLACLVLEENLIDLPIMPTFEEGITEQAARQILRGWQREGSHTFTLTERRRDVCKRAIAKQCDKGAVSGPALLCLLNQFGLAPKDT